MFPILFDTTQAKRKYYQKVLGLARTNLLGYWPLWETAGTTADNLEGTAARDGSYTGVGLGGGTFGNGDPVPFFDGTNDFVNVYSANLAGVFNGKEGAVAGWLKPFDADVWGDGSLRNALMLSSGGDGATAIRKTGTAKLEFQYDADASSFSILSDVLATTNWIHVAMTWSVAADEFKAYLNGVQLGATQTGLGAWDDPLISTQAVIGALSTGAIRPWHGYLAHWAIWNAPLSAAQVLSLATV